MKTLFIAIITILSTSNDMFSQEETIKEKLTKSKDFIFIEKLPATSEIKSLSIHHKSNIQSVLDESVFVLLLNKAKAIQPDDDLLMDWNYTPWYYMELLTPSGKYEIELFLGGLGFMTLPNGKKGALMFDLEEAE